MRYTSAMHLSRVKALLLINLISLTGFQVFVPLYALFASEVGATPAQVGIIWSYYSLIMATLIFVFGKLENTRPKEWFLVIGYFIFAAGAFLFLLVDSITSLVLVLSFNAIGGGLSMPAYKTIFAKSEDLGRESEEWAWLDSSIMFAAAGGSAIGGAIIGLAGFTGLFITMGFIQLIAAIIGLVYFVKNKHVSI